MVGFSRFERTVERKAVAGELPRLRWQILSDNPVGRREIYEGLHRANQAWWKQWADSIPDPGTGALAWGHSPPPRREANEPEVLDVVPQEEAEDGCP